MDIDVDEEYPILRYATADMLLAHENEAYLESQGKILSQQEEISKLTIQHQYLQYVPVCAQKSESSPLNCRELYDKALGRLQRSGSSRGQSGACEKPPASSAYPPLRSDRTTLPRLDHSEYPHVKYWTRQQWDNYCAENKGKTNGLAQTIGKRGRPAKTTSDELNDSNDDNAKHPYVETVEGRPVSALHLHRIGVKARAIWTSLANRGLAPEKFMKMDAAAKEYYFTEMCNEFFEFRLCSDAWKLELWSSKNYSSWAQNHLDSKKENAKRRKLERDAKAKELASITGNNSSNDSSHQRAAPGPSSNDIGQTPFGSGFPNIPPRPSSNDPDTGSSSPNGSPHSPDETGNQMPPGLGSSNDPPCPPPPSNETPRQPLFENNW